MQHSYTYHTHNCFKHWNRRHRRRNRDFIFLLEQQIHGVCGQGTGKGDGRERMGTRASPSRGRKAQDTNRNMDIGMDGCRRKDLQHEMNIEISPPMYVFAPRQSTECKIPWTPSAILCAETRRRNAQRSTLLSRTRKSYSNQKSTLKIELRMSQVYRGMFDVLSDNGKIYGELRVKSA